MLDGANTEWLQYPHLPTKSLPEEVPECPSLSTSSKNQSYKPNKQLNQPFHHVAIHSQYATNP